MKPEEFRRFSKTQAIIFKEGARPIKANKIIYYKEKDFNERLYTPVDVPTLEIEQNHPARFENISRKDDDDGGSFEDVSQL